ncbi:MAG: phosphoribosylamine--glycine ligase [Erythrobacter sp.]|jgi:phosphoribosylamine--glycine ligase|nr:phosphoribosylamine--glycine ligase [Erythrobacter sp.]
MNILLLGSGGREHALSWKLAQSPSLTKLYAAPGNPGMAEEAELVALDPGNHADVAAFACAKDIDLVVVGPEQPLVDGLADHLREAGITVFGPSAAAAQLEGSKGFTKDLCARAGIPTAAYHRAASLEDALALLERFDAPYVLKADGLAAGKGVVIAETREEAVKALGAMFAGQFGAAGTTVVMEEFLRGEEASVFALTDGDTIRPFGTAQDHKRVGEGDQGPNTGGMGAYSPAPVLDQNMQDRIMAEIIEPTVATMKAGGVPYSGVLYAGLMLTEEGPKLIEYNCRFGDPECQVLMMRLSSDLAAALHACATGRLSEAEIAFATETALTVVMAANGYPGTPETGGRITFGKTESEGTKIFHAGTARAADGTLVAKGGRVLNVTATGATIEEAQSRAYAVVREVDFPTGFYRRDIGRRELERGARDI